VRKGAFPSPPWAHMSANGDVTLPFISFHKNVGDPLRAVSP